MELNEMISYVWVLRVAPLYLLVYVDENRHRLRYPCQRHILYLKRPHTLITEWSERVPQWLWSMRCTVMTVQRMLHNHCTLEERNFSEPGFFHKQTSNFPLFSKMRFEHHKQMFDRIIVSYLFRFPYHFIYLEWNLAEPFSRWLLVVFLNYVNVP